MTGLNSALHRKAFGGAIRARRPSQDEIAGWLRKRKASLDLKEEIFSVATDLVFAFDIAWSWDPLCLEQFCFLPSD